MGPMLVAHVSDALGCKGQMYSQSARDLHISIILGPEFVTTFNAPIYELVYN